MTNTECEKLNIGDKSSDLQIEIIDKDRLCYLVRNESRGSYGIRTISKRLLQEYIEYFRDNPGKTANDARDSLCGKTDLDKFEYGYSATLAKIIGLIKFLLNFSYVNYLP